MIEIANERLNSAMPRIIEQLPIQAAVVMPFPFLAKLAAHEHELLPRMAELKGIISAKICKPLPFVTRHSAED